MSTIPLRKVRTADDLAAAPDSMVVDVLNDRYQKLNEKWEEAEASLKRFPIPHEVTHCISSDDSYETYLGFAKVKGAWRICWCIWSHEQAALDDEFYRWCPITEC